jgi:hypothetical protein
MPWVAVSLSLPRQFDKIFMWHIQISIDKNTATKKKIPEKQKNCL